MIGTSVGAHGGQWAHEDTRRSARVAGAEIIEDIVLSHRYEFGTDPVADAGTVAAFADAIRALVDHEQVAA